MTTNESEQRVGVGVRVYETLRAMVLDLQLPPGAPLGETELSARLGVSRTPVREALGRLAREGLVRQYPGRGAFVSEISVPDIVELYRMREALEGHAARLAAESATDEDRAQLTELLAEFERQREPLLAGDAGRYYELVARLDELIIRMAGNQRLRVALQEVWAQIRRARRVASKSPTRLLDTVDEHVAIVTAIRDGDADKAASETLAHVRLSLANITTSLVSGVV